MNALLLIIDFINDIVHPDGKIASVADYVANHQVIKHANQAIAIARKKQLPIVHVKVGFSPNYIECPLHSPLFGKAKELQALKLGDWGTEFHSNIDVQASDSIIIKHRVSPLYATPLEAILKANQIDTVIISGVATNNAVETVARELHDRDYRLLVLKDACGAANEAIHEASLLNLSRIATVCHTSEMGKNL